MNGYVDFHSGVLPRMDAENLEAEVEKSVEILKILHKAKIKTVVATPYFNSVDDNVPSFLAKREEAYKLLSEKIKGLSLPRVILGSEVLFTTSLLDTKGVNKLCVGDTNYIMLALPYQEYSEMVLETLQKIIISRNLCPIIAHIEKYLEFYTMEQIEKISSLGVIMQLSCDAIINRATRKDALELLSRNVVQIIGSNDITKMVGGSDITVQEGGRSKLEVAMDVLNTDITANISETIAPSPQYADAIRIMRYHLPLGKYKQIKNNAGMIISNANIKDIMC
ncbi:MAG: hypothetical protein IJP18_09450 [Oscillospiraceae bacterium]|nr:hypothetical protein [Oscillospiraceae bacterium]MBQ9982777.1 hypothetical protein [Oscillospiraceae bacterium]